MDYKNKYIKYKNKYIDMLNQKGGTKTFNLENEYNYFILEDLQNNLVELENHFGNSFYIKFGDINLKFELEKINHNPYVRVQFLKFLILIYINQY
jgi:hypothetical protein